MNKQMVPQAFFPKNIIFLTTEGRMKQVVLNSKKKSLRSIDTGVTSCWLVLLTAIWTVTGAESSTTLHFVASWEREQYWMK